MTGSNTFGGTIKLEGEKAYREAVKQINSNLRVLASEMGKVTAEFTKNDKSTTALTSRNKILNEQIEKQKEKISVLKNALAQSSEKYGENDKKTNNWKVSLNKAEAELSEQGTKLKELQTEYKNVVLSQGKNSSEAKSLASEIKSLNNDIRENKEKLNAAEKATSQLGDEMNGTKNQTSKLSEGFTVMKGIIANLAIKNLCSFLCDDKNEPKNVPRGLRFLSNSPKLPACRWTARAFFRVNLLKV